jgi:hypothetical protein
MQSRRVKILGKYWRMVFQSLGRHRHEGEKVHGLCDPVVVPKKTILIDSRLSGQLRLESIIHEIIHAGDQCAVGFVHSEDYVTHLAHDIARILTQLGYCESPQNEVNS